MKPEAESAIQNRVLRHSERRIHPPQQANSSIRAAHPPLSERLEILRRGYLARHGRKAEEGQCHLCGAEACLAPTAHLLPAIVHLRSHEPEGIWCEVCLSRAFAFTCNRCGTTGIPFMELGKCPKCADESLCPDCLPGGSLIPCLTCTKSRGARGLMRGLRRLWGALWVPRATVRPWALPRS